MPWEIAEEERQLERRVCNLFARIKKPKGDDTRSWAQCAEGVLLAQRCPPTHPDLLAIRHVLAQGMQLTEQRRQREESVKRWKPTFLTLVTRRWEPPQNLTRKRVQYLQERGWTWSKANGHWWAWETQETRETQEQESFL